MILRVLCYRDPLPQLLTGGKPICAATIRVGLGYLEVPFFATADTKRNRGYGRALLEAIEDIARCGPCVALPRLTFDKLQVQPVLHAPQVPVAASAAAVQH